MIASNCLFGANRLLAVAILVACQSADRREPNAGGAGVTTAPADTRPVVVDETHASSDVKSTGAEGFDIKKSRDPVTGETSFAVTLERCSFEARAGVDGSEMLITRHSSCELSPIAYVALWRQVLRESIATLAFRGGTIHLLWGRLAAPAHDSMAAIMSQRLVASVRKSTAWDARRGKPNTARLEEFVRENSGPETVFPELLPIARELGFDAATEHVEKVLVGGPDSWPSVGGEFSKSEKLPYDAQIVFVLKRLPN
jgi:hypothetical protein